MRAGFNRNELIVISAMSVTGLVWGADQLAMPLYLSRLGLTPFEVGALIGGMMIFGSLVGLLFSALADAYSRRPFATVGRLIAFLAFLALFLRIPIAALFVTGLGGASLGALLAESATDLDRDFSMISSASTGLSVVGASVPWLLGLRYTMLFNSLVMGSTAASLLAASESYRGTRRVTLRLKSIGNVAKLSTQAFIGLGAGLILPMMSLWFSLRFHVTVAQLSPVYMASNALLSAATLTAPVLGKRLGRVKAITLTHAGGIALLLALPACPAFLTAAGVFIARNVLMNMAGPLFNSLIMDIIPREERARANSILGIIDSLPRASGPFVTGYIFSVGNLWLPFYVTASLYTAATAVFYLLFNNVNRASHARS
ncbi:MAG: MFS transporter [Acidilobus sp.]